MNENMQEWINEWTNDWLNERKRSVAGPTVRWGWRRKNQRIAQAIQSDETRENKSRPFWGSTSERTDYLGRVVLSSSSSRLTCSALMSVGCMIGLGLASPVPIWPLSARPQEYTWPSPVMTTLWKEHEDEATTAIGMPGKVETIYTIRHLG